MKKIAAFLLCILLTVSLIAFSGCSSKETKPDNSRPGFLTVGTASSGGAYYPIGISIADIITNELGIQTTAQVTGGAVENNTLIQNKKVDLAITQSSMAYAAFEGKEPYSEKHPDVNILFNGLSKGVFHVVVMKDSGINSMADLKGKRVVMGPAGGGAINMARDVWSVYGFGIEDVNATYVSYSDGISSLKDGKVDAVVIQSAAPASAIKELAATTKNFRILSVEEEKVKEILELYPYYGKITLNKEMYGTDENVETIYVTNMVVVNKNMSKDLAYDITKVLFENIDKIKESNPAAKDLKLEEAANNLPIPMHPGALKYFTEKGVVK
ncbi:MAG TPA: TAXI family TRAP transporter solute-binding subunit [Thermoanaerobacterales bacterium]|nr:TAXI family TRAP transporter solute-binding subunit [Thermoanaerobacterales bacterium]